MEVLIVEDDLISRRLLKNSLTRLGHQVVEAENGGQAWRLLEKSSIQIVITDWLMPDTDGNGLCRKIRAASFEHYVYVIALTSRDYRKDLIEILKGGADDYIDKPFDPEELGAKITIGLRVIQLEERQKRMAATLLESQTKIGNLSEASPELQNAMEGLERTQAQMLQSEKMASIGQLAAGVAHEINNPTGFINSNLRTLQDYQRDFEALIRRYRDLIGMVRQSSFFDQVELGIKDGCRQLEAFEKEIDLDFLLKDSVDLVNDCREGADRIKKIVLDLKAFAHPGDDRIQSTDINKGLESTLSVVHNALKYKATVERSLGQVPTVRGYPQQLNQVFMNILINAAQAIESRGIIKVRTLAVNDQVEVVISDDGCGIAPKHLSKIFDPFFTTKAVGQGTGLGMNIAYNIIKKHQGAIEVQSELGKGTTFTIRLPAEREVQSEAAVQQAGGFRAD